MKRRIKNIIGFAITVALIVVMVCWLGHLVRPVNTDVAFNAIETFHSMPENSIEVIGYGSSHMWRGVDPMKMYEKYGIGAYNYGCNWQSLDTTLLFLEDSLRTQSPKVVLIETLYVNNLLRDSDVIGEIYYTRGISDFEGKQKYLKKCFGDDWERYLSYYMPLCAFHDNWINIKAESFEKNASNRDFYKTMGFFETDVVVPVTIGDSSAFEQVEIMEDSRAVLDEMVAICREKNIDIIFFTVPWQGSYALGDAMTRYAEENGCQYFDFFELQEEVGLDCKTDYGDTAHLNSSGAAKVADFLGAYIVGNYDVTDMRTIEGNIWEENSRR